MLARLMERLNDRRDAVRDGEEAADAGFTLIELMVVLLILAILLAIAIPTFLGVTNSANDRAAQSNLNTALTDAKSVYESNQQVYPAASGLLASLQSNEPSLAGSLTTNTGSLPTTGGGIAVYVSSDSNGAVFVALAKKTNECWVVADNSATVSDTGAGSPYKSTTSAGGIPTAAGEYYGVYKSDPGASTPIYCGISSVQANLTKTQTSGFPPAA